MPQVPTRGMGQDLREEEVSLVMPVPYWQCKMQDKPTLKRQPADSVPYGDAISKRGGYVWCAYDGDRLVCVAATAKEARTKYYRVRLGDSYGKAAPQFLNSHPLRPQHLTDKDLKAMGLETKKKRGGN